MPTDPVPAVPAQPKTLSSPQGDVGAGGSVPQNLPELSGGPVRPRGAKELSHSQDKTHSRNADETLKPTSAPAVPAQEAPRCYCGDMLTELGCPSCDPKSVRPAEPQAGAQVPSQWEEALREWWRTGVLNPKIIAVEDAFKAGWDARSKVPSQD